MKRKGTMYFSSRVVTQSFVGTLFPALEVDLSIVGQGMSGTIKKIFASYRFYDDSAGTYYRQTNGGDLYIDNQYIILDSVVPSTIQDVAIPMENFDGNVNLRFKLDNLRIVRVGFQPTRTGWAGDVPPAAVAPDFLEFWVTIGYVFD